MKAKTTTDSQLRRIFQSAHADARDLLVPLLELSEDSPSLVVGYAAAQPGWNVREDLIPYYHVLGKSGDSSPVRVLLTSGWYGNEESASYTLLRLVAAMESRFQIVDGVEATVYPIVNLDAREAMVVLTPEQRQKGIALWQGSEVRHVRVIERELWRYDYDLAIRLEEVVSAEEFGVTFWGASEITNSVLVDSLKSYQSVSPGFFWEQKPFDSPTEGRLTPVPERMKQPTEILVKLPGGLLAEQQSEEGLGLLLSLIHSVREARSGGTL